jgi:CRISPR-associated protein Cmr5
MSNTPSPKTASPDQRRARHAWSKIQQILEQYPCQQKNGKLVPHEKAKRIGAQAKKLPIRILASGLGQALAFLRAKDYAPELLSALGDWVLDKRSNPESDKSPPDAKALIEAIVKGSSDTLRRATMETLAYLQWFNRFAEAEHLTEGDS